VSASHDLLARLAAAQPFIARGNELRGAGRVEDAIASYRKAVEIAPDAGAGHYNLGIALRQARAWRDAVLAFREAARCDPRDFDAVQNVVTTIATAVEGAAPTLFPRQARRTSRGTQPVSIVMCSATPARLEAALRGFRAALGAREHEFVVIPDARSLTEGYTRGLAKSRHGIVVFSHDDVELMSGGPFEALDRALEGNDVVGIAGARLVTGPAVMWSGHPHLGGFVALPDAQAPESMVAWVYSLECGVLAGMQSLDGMFLAARREAALAIGWDTATFDGFHFYDLDFTYRAHLAGLRVALTTDISALHMSDGSFDASWQRHAARFVAKFPAMSAPHGANHSYRARLGSRENTLRFFEEIRGLAQS
jgi:hypothetical protein